MEDQINKVLISVFSEKISSSEKKKKNIFIKNLVDSFAVIELILGLEKEFDIKIEAGNIKSEAFLSTNSIKELIIKVKNAS